MSHLQLLRVEIEGFRKFKEPFVLDLSTPSGSPLDYLVLAGPNGCGKTTILEAILLVLGRDDLIVRDLDSKDRTGSPRVRMCPDARLRATIRDKESNRCIELERTARSSKRQSVNPRVEFHDMAEYEAWARALPLIDDLSVEYISARRQRALIGPVQDETRGRPPDNTESNRLWLFKDRLRKQQGRRVPGYKGPEPRDVEWLERLNAYWRDFRNDGTTFAMTVVNPDDLDTTQWDLFLYQGDVRICPIDEMSSGEQEILAMAVPFITEEFDGLLLIDEPEQHLHPQWQGRVLRALRKLVPNSQVIVATHADDPWDDAMSWERRLLVEADDPRAHAASGAVQ